MVSITCAVDRIKGNLSRFIPESLIVDICRQIGHRWRERKLGPVMTVMMMIQQMLGANASLTQTRRQVGGDFTPQALDQARRRLPAALWRGLLRHVIQVQGKVADPDEAALWHGHRTFYVDGSSCSLPDVPALQKHFGQPGGQKPGCGFPVAHLLFLFDAASGMILDLVVSPLRTHDLHKAKEVHPMLRPGDVLVGDRGFCSYAHLALLWMQGIYGCFRLHQRMIVDFTPGRSHSGKGRPRSRWIKRLGRNDQLVEWIKPATRPVWMDPAQWAQLPSTLRVRELSYHVERRGFRTQRIYLATTLTDQRDYYLSDLAGLYAGRWQAEVNLRNLKQTLKLEVLRSRGVEQIIRDLLVLAVVYNLVCAVMNEAARKQKVSVCRISFKDALCWLLHAGSEDEVPPLVVNPRRRRRPHPRAVKRRPKSYALLNKPRQEACKALLAQTVDD